MGITPVPRHPQVQAPGRVPAIHVRLDEGGGIAALAALNADRVAALWTFRDGNHNAFPFVQLKEPLLGHKRGGALRDEVDGADATQRREALVQGVKDVGSWSSPFSAKLIKRCEERRAAVAGIDPSSACVPAVLERGVAAMRKEDFVAMLAEAIIEHESKGLLGGDGLDVAAQALIGDAKRAGPALFFDVATGFGDGHGQSTAAVRGGKSVHAANVAAALAAAGAGDGTGPCSLTGETTDLHDGPFPKPTLPTVGGAYIHARNVKDIPASRRYHDETAFPVRGDLPPLLAGTLEALCDTTRKNLSWRSVPSEKAKQSDLLVATVEVDAQIAIAQALTGPDVSEEDAEDAGASIELLVKTLDAKLTDGWNDEVPQATLLLLRKIDPGNVKAVMSRRLSAAHLLDAARAWRKGWDNVAPVRLPTGKGKPMAGPRRIAPLQLPAITRASFLRRGTQRAPQPAPGLSPQEALALFLGDPDAPRIAVRALGMILRRQGDLLVATGHARHRGEFGAADNEAVLRATGALGVLLPRVKPDRKDAMSDDAYKLGQLLAAADTLHAGYCEDVRKGDMPPTLLGNEVLGVAQRSPVQGLDLLGRRIRPYQAWGQRQPRPTDKPSKERAPREQRLTNAFFSRIHLERLAGEIDRQALQAIPDDLARAQMILGYLAGPDRKKLDTDQQGETIDEA